MLGEGSTFVGMKRFPFASAVARGFDFCPTTIEPRYEKRTSAAFITLTLLVVLTIFYPPSFDLSVASAFFSAQTGLFLGSERASRYLQQLLMVVTSIHVTVCLALLAVNRVRSLEPFRAKLGFQIMDRKLMFLLLALAIGPGLVVNGIFKEAWGRARPRDVVQFGGARRFTPALVLSDECKTNCSFVSGEAALGFYGLSFMFLARRRRKMIALTSLLFGFFIGLVRMSVGAHFLSDVIFSGVFTFLVSFALYFVLLRPIRKTAYDSATGRAIEAPQGKFAPSKNK